VTPAGRYHVRVLDLNADVFIKHRKLRADLRTFMTETPMIIKRMTFEGLPAAIQLVKDFRELMIPAIRYGAHSPRPKN
jgi:hypothetical protein